MNFGNKLIATLALPVVVLVVVQAVSSGLRSCASSAPEKLAPASPALAREDTRSLQIEPPVAPASLDLGTSAAYGLNLIETESDPVPYSQKLAQAADSILDFRSALDALNAGGFTSQSAADLRQALLQRWTKLEPNTAATWSAQLAGQAGYNDAVRQVATAWGGSEPAKAATWATSLPDGEAKTTAVLSVAFEAARTEPALALEAAGKLEPSRERDEALLHGVSQWAGSEPSAAAGWAAAVADPAVRELLLSGAAIAGAERDPVAAAALVARSLSPGEAQERAAVAVVQRWAQTDPQAAADWVSEFPDTPARTAAAANLVSIWAALDQQAAADGWSRCRKVPFGPQRWQPTRAQRQIRR